jgi:FMN phosphatase YigB (HAD superfamily)
MPLAIFDLDNTLLNGDSDYLWGQYLGEIGVVDRTTTSAKTSGSTPTTAQAGSTSWHSCVFLWPRWRHIRAEQTGRLACGPSWRPRSSR